MKQKLHSKEQIKMVWPFGHVMQMGEDRIPKEMPHKKMEGKRPRGRLKIRWIGQIIKDIKMRGEKWEEIQTAGDFSVIVDPYIWN